MCVSVCMWVFGGMSVRACERMNAYFWCEGGGGRGVSACWCVNVYVNVRSSESVCVCIDKWVCIRQRFELHVR